MALRITTNAILGNYSRNLNKSMLNLEESRQRVLTKRNFNKVSEDPAAAAKAFQLRREYQKNNSYLDNIETVQGIFDGVEASALQVSKALQNVNSDTLAAINGATSMDEKKVYAKTLREQQQSIILSMNAKFGDRFINGGANLTDVPLVLGADGKVTYRGLDVDDPANQDALKALSEEHLYVDLGFGMKEDGNGTLVSDSAFDLSMPAINFLGYGTTQDGVSKNVVSLLGQMADALESEDFDEAKFEKMTDQLTACRDKVVNSVAELGVKSNFLENTKNRLEDNKLTLNEKIVAIENVDMAEAITDYSWAEYAYNAALKVGNSILSPSFIDFMS